MDKSDMDTSGDWDMVSSVKSEEAEKEEDKGPDDNENQKESAGSTVEEIVDPENVLASDSDFDVIDENVDQGDMAPEKMIIPSFLSISSFVAEKVSESSSDETASTPSDAATTLPPQLEANDSENAQTEDSSHSTGADSSFTSWRFLGRNVNDWIHLLLEYFQSLTGFQIGSLLGLTFCIYFCITINQTNIIALQEKGNVVAQMEKLVDELRYDNKHLQEKMLSEMKNDKLVSSFEHQIRELKKENSKLNHMLLDVVKVLEEQKDTQEKLLVKKESEYQAPFKKEINKLREHINMLKIDNEELQKQLVRMRYSSYSQGSKHESEKEAKDHGKQKRGKDSASGPEDDTPEKETKEETGKEKSEKESNELPLDILQLKRWNELLDRFIKENNLFASEGGPEDEKKEKWNWKGLKTKFKSSTEFVAEVAHFFDSKPYQKMFKDAYKSASKYLADAQENVQSLFESPEDTPDKNPDKKSKVWGVFDGLGKKLGQVKKKIIMNYGFDEKECPAEKGDTANVDGSQPDPSAGHADTSKEYQVPDSHRKSTQYKTQNPNEKWFFKRAHFREKLRDVDEEGSKNWFLKRRRDSFSEAGDDEGKDGPNERE